MTGNNQRNDGLLVAEGAGEIIFVFGWHFILRRFSRERLKSHGLLNFGLMRMG